MQNSDLFKRQFNRWIDAIRAGWEREQARGVERMRRAQSERRVFLLICLIILGIIVVEGYVLDHVPINGTTCDVPDPYGR